jgi:hypothetical protein
MHKVRLASLASCVSSLLNGAKASVTGMGRGIFSSVYYKHPIKQADRLLSNKLILEEALSIYKAIYKQFASAPSRPIILIATLASILANIIGLAMFMAGLHFRYQANTVKKRRVLSLHYLGLRGYVNKRLILLCDHYEAAVLNLRTMIAANFNG